MTPPDPRALLAGYFAPGEAVEDGSWLRVRMDRLDPGQRSGWKLHLSATPASYGDMLRLALPVLAAAGTPFKLARDADEVERLASGERGLMQVGKCVTVYPAAEQAAAALAGALASATRGIPGPAVPTDCPFAPDAPVYFRFGPYDGRMEIDAMAQERRLVWRPDLGRDVWDVTSGGPEVMPTRTVLPDSAPPDHLAFLRDRYTLLRLLHLSAKGGVFLATENCAPTPVPLLIKTARAGTNSDLHGRDAIWALRREHALLARLADVPGLPPAGEFIEGVGACALVRPYLHGETFWERWTAPNARLAAPRAELACALDEIEATAAALHARGIVARDIAPGNVLLTPERACLMDLELAHWRDCTDPPYRRGTRGFYDPGTPREAAPSPDDDFFALNTLRRMLAEWPEPPFARAAAASSDPLPDPTAYWHETIAGFRPEGRAQGNWNVYSGLSGLILGALDCGVRVGDLPIVPEWLTSLRRAAEDVLHVPGLHFGASGFALALHHLGDPEFAQSILTQVAERAADSRVPDVCQGLAGHLHVSAVLARLVPGSCYAHLAGTAAERLVLLAEATAAGPVWRWPQGPYGDLSGAVCHGFAHGAAGVLHALLTWHTVSPSETLDTLVRQGLHALLAAARPVPGGGSARWWPVSNTDSTCWNAWCHGTPGVIGLLALGARHGLVRASEVAAAVAGMYCANAFESCLCHGVASRLRAFTEAAAVPGVHIADEIRAHARHDAKLLARALHAGPAAFGEETGLLTGPPGAYLTLHAAGAEIVAGADISVH